MKSLSLSRPHAILMVGIPGSGKSQFAQKFAETFSAPCVSDSLISTYIDDFDTIKKINHAELDEIIKTQQTFVFDGDLNDRDERTTLVKKLTKAGFEILLIWVQTDVDTAKSRSFKIHKDRSDKQYQSLSKRFMPPTAKEHPLVISGKHTFASQTKVVLKKLTTERASISFHPIPPTRSLSDIRPSR